MAEHTRRFLLRLAPGLKQAIDPGDIFFLEAVGDDTHVRTRRAERLVDVRQVRRRPSGDDWELKLDPPVNRVLPISRTALSSVWKAFGEE